MTEFVLGGGCFWCLDAVYRRIKGVTSSECGYAGGHDSSPNYYSVATGRTGHAEVVRVQFDETVVPTEVVLDIFFLIHDPTTPNRQGADEGTQYRSTMLYKNDTQKALFQAAAKRTTEHWGDPIVTEIKPLEAFYTAEDEHQDYFNKNPEAGYCQIVITPKVIKARATYKKWFKEGNKMKLTKYEHACFTVEKDNQMLVVDPGGFTTDFIAPEHIVAVVITHEHMDHFDHDQLAAIIDKNPEAIIYAHEDITKQIEVFQTQSVNAGDTITVGPFNLAFYGGKHAEIDSSIPIIANLGVMINDLLYYPGDSFVIPDASVDTLALPACAPWMKGSEAIAFLTSVRPRLVFPTHDAILSNSGKMIYDGLYTRIANQNNITFTRLTDPIEI